MTYDPATDRLPTACAECGGVYERDSGNYATCPTCKPHRPEPATPKRKRSSSSRGYGWQWRKLSERARRLSPQCEDCGSVHDLTTDHSVSAWQRIDSGLPVRLEDVAVVCRRCNSERGAARGERAGQHTRWERPDLNQLARELELADQEPDDDDDE